MAKAKDLHITASGRSQGDTFSGKQYVGMWLTQIKFCASHMDLTGVMNTSETLFSLPKRLFLAKGRWSVTPSGTLPVSSVAKKKGLKLGYKTSTHVTAFTTGPFVLHLQLF